MDRVAGSAAYKTSSNERIDMDILFRKYAPATAVDAGVVPSDALLLTDCATLAAWAEADGIAVVRATAFELENDARRRALLDRLGSGPLLYGIGFSRDDRAIAADGVEREAGGMLALLSDLIRRGEATRVVAMRRPEAYCAAMFDGMLMTARQESARVRGASLIVHDAPGARTKAAIATALSGDGARWRLHDGVVERETVESLPATDRRRERLRQGGCYVVVGGAGGVGRLLAARLAERYRANVCVIGRSALDDALRSRLKASGVRTYAQADVADFEAVKSAMETFAARFGRIDGAFHLAGATRDRMIVNKQVGECVDVVRPKVAGALNLDRLRGVARPEFVCAFTSLSGFVGNLGQSDYAAANAWVDALVADSSVADASRGAGDARRPEWLAINWGLWDSEGMQIGAERGELRAMPSEAALDALERILASDVSVAVAFEGDPAVLGAMSPATAQASTAAGATSPAAAAAAPIVDWLRELVFRYTKLRDIDAEASLIELGVDSSSLISLVSAIEKRLSDAVPGVRMNKAVVFDHASISALAEHLRDAHPDATRIAFASSAPIASPAAPPVASPATTARVEPAPTHVDADPMPATLSWLRTLLRRFTGIVDADAGADLLRLGVDSVASIHLSGEIERRLSSVEPVRIPKSLVFDHANLGAIARYLMASHGRALAIALAAEPASAPATVPARDVARPSAAPSIDAASERAAPTPASAPAIVASGDRDGDIAIVGMAGEFPGADDVDALWAMLESGREAIAVVPEQRWSWQQDYSPDPKRSGASYGRHGGFLRRAKQFDPAFFGITPVEAVRIDPQERRLLETAYHALEDGGHFAMPESETGVFVAAMFGHYQNLDAPNGPISASFSSIANRISFTFNFQGPSLCVDTMCSGALTALHLAVSSLRSGECARALVGAVNVMPHPGKFRLLSEGRFLSPSGRCHTFGVEADGYVPGEGAVAVVLKRLSDAIADGDRIHGVIRGSALNSGGRVAGFTVPSGRAQERVVRRAIEQAGVDPAEVDYIEAHGTGTSLGDPIEIRALDAAYGRHAAGRRVGSIKSNIGHLESAAGLAGLVKVLLQFRHGRFAPTLNCTLVNPYLQLESTSFVLPRDAAPWPRSDGRPRIAGLSSFGAGGSNAHVIVQEYLQEDRSMAAAGSSGDRGQRWIMPISARNARALRAGVERLADWLERHPDADPYAVGCTLARHREHLRERICFAASDAIDFASQLRAWLAGSMATHPAASAGATDAERAIVGRYLAGAEAAFASLYPRRAQLPLPHYAFDEREYWDDAIVARAAAAPLEAEAHRAAQGQDAGEEHALIVLEPDWRPWPASAVDASPVAGARTIVVCSQATAAVLRRRSDAASDLAFVVVADDAPPFSEGGDVRTIRPGEIADAVDAIRAVVDGRKAWMIVFEDAFSDPERDAPIDVAGAHFALAKAVVETGAVDRIAYAHAADADPVASAIPALYRVLGMEEPAIRTLTLEVDRQAFPSPEALLDRVFVELSDRDARDALRRIDARGRRSADLRAVSLDASNPSRFREGGVYLITGGLGMIGQGVAAELMRRFSATVVLVGRSAAGADTERRLASLRGNGGRVEYLSVDLGDAGATASLVGEIVRRHGALHGVFHSAGVLRDGLLRGKTRRDFDAVLAAKIAGARHLDLATAPLDLDLFVLFSSVSGVFGNVGQADYALGNAFLDAFAGWRRREVVAGRRRGLTLSIDWPLWYDDADADMDRMREYRSLGDFMYGNYGIAPLSLRNGCALLVRLVDGVSADTSQIMPLVGDRKRILASVAGRALHAIDAEPRKPQTAGIANPIAPSAPVTDAATTTALADEIAACVARLTGLSDEDVDRRASYGDLGLSSVMLQSLASELETLFGRAIPPSALFTYNTIEALADYFASVGVAPPGAAQAAAPTPARTGDIDDAPVATGVAEGAAPAPDARDDGRIAIVGIDGRLPGGRDLDGFWHGLAENRSAICPVERWPDYPSFAGTIPEIDHFDAKFFGISAREAALMDPQHRLFLQCSYNAMLDAGYSPRALSSVGVFAGVQFSDYQTLLQTAMQGGHPYAATGNAHAMLANRVSYLFDFEGPSQTIDTACSSALVAVNRAVMALRSGECDYAIAGAVSLLIDSAMTRAAESMGVLSPRFRCATFDAEADGYVRAEGVGCVLLKRYADAVRDGDAIHAVIESVAENHGGRANSLTAPNPNAQRRLLMRAYSPELARRVSYIETHGTGTKLGDPVEIDALKSAWRELVPDAPEAGVVIGSVKSNIGHLEPAAGIASLLKVVLAMRHRLLPANLHFRQRNPYIALEDSPFRIADANLPWRGDGRVAGISSFGFGGTNAHIVVSQAPEERARAEAGGPALVVLSARSPKSLMAMKTALASHLRGAQGAKAALRDVATTLALGREHFEYRLAWVVDRLAGLVEALDAADGGDIRRVERGAAPAAHAIASDDLTGWRDAYLAGREPDWSRIDGFAGGRRVHLPGYAFDTRAYWFEATAAAVAEQA